MKFHTNITKSAFKAAYLLALCAGFAGCGTGADNQPAISNNNLDNISATDDGNFVKPVALMTSAAIPATAVGADTDSSTTPVAEIDASIMINTSNALGYMVINEPTPYPLPACRRRGEIEGWFYHQMNVQVMPLPYTPESECFERIYSALPLPLPYPLPSTNRHPVGMTELTVVN